MNRVVDAIASDLQIEKAAFENDSQFFSRVIYSAMAQWVKEITLQNCAEQSPNYSCSKATVTRQSAEILGTLLDVVPESKPWFANLELLDVSRMIREGLENVGDLVDSGFDNKITVCNNTRLCISNENAIMLGKYMGGNRSASGLGLISGCSGIEKTAAHTRFDPESRRIYELNTKNGDRVSDIEEYEVFDPTIKKQALSECWRDISTRLKAGEYIIRKKQMHGPGTYLYLCVYNSGLMKVSVFDNYLVTSKDYRLHYLKQRYEAGNPVVARLNSSGPYYKLDLFTRLPAFEEEILNYLSWPIDSITNRNNRLLSSRTKGYIEKLLNNIYIQVECYE